MLAGNYKQPDQTKRSREQAVRRPLVFDRDFDLLRACAFQRCVRTLRMQRVQEVIVTLMAIVLGSVAGWAMVR
jgi:hypothetical protein